jgi:hypothetical protein
MALQLCLDFHQLLPQAFSGHFFVPLADLCQLTNRRLRAVVRLVQLGGRSSTTDNLEAGPLLEMSQHLTTILRPVC